jgi:hypothetical protein
MFNLIIYFFVFFFQEHLLWSPTCGKVTNDGEEWNLTSKPGERYLDNKPTMIRYPLELILYLMNRFI